MRRLLIFILLCALPTTASTQQSLTAKEAANRIGDSVVVEDSVIQAFRLGNSESYLVIFGDIYPDQVLYAIVPPKSEGFPDVSLWRGAWVRIQGFVSVASDGPRIICEEPSQIELLRAPLGRLDPPPAAAPAPTRTCCKICRTGKACGNSCISRSKTCRKKAGCACNG